MPYDVCIHLCPLCPPISATCSDQQGAELQQNKYWKWLWYVMKEHVELQKSWYIYSWSIKNAFYAD